MIFGGKKASFLLLVGDLVAFAASLPLTLIVRYGRIPSVAALTPYLIPFSFLFVLWLLVFYMAGLYGKRLALFPSRLPDVLLATQVTNIILAALFFFAVPTFGITPKTVLGIYLLISLALIYIWRLVLYPLSLPEGPRVRAVLIAEGAEADELAEEVKKNPRYGLEFVLVLSPSTIPDPTSFFSKLESKRVSLIVADTALIAGRDIVPLVYELSRLSRRYQFAEFEDVYEEAFDRVPLSRLSYEWFLRNVSPANAALYTLSKRVIDLAGSILMGAITVIILPFVYIAITLEGPGPIFIAQERIGERGRPIRTYKFRSMQQNLSASSEWAHEGENRVTRVGAILRKTSLDEFPQWLNVFTGELSLVGPRNDTAGLAKRLSEALPYYNARYLVRPGITGWAQINQQYEQGNFSPQSIKETKVRLAYDFYYLKHRSLGLDIVIALKTIKRMFFRVSS